MLSSEIHQLKGIMLGVLSLLQERQELSPLGEWISERDARKITGLSASSLLRLRQRGMVRASFLTQRSVFYRLSDIHKLLEKNARLR